MEESLLIKIPLFGVYNAFQDDSGHFVKDRVWGPVVFLIISKIVLFNNFFI